MAKKNKKHEEIIEIDYNKLYESIVVTVLKAEATVYAEIADYLNNITKTYKSKVVETNKYLQSQIDYRKGTLKKIEEKFNGK